MPVIFFCFLPKAINTIPREIEKQKIKVLFFDEIQIVEEWENISIQATLFQQINGSECLT